MKEKVKTEIVGGSIISVRDLAVYRKAFDAAMEIFTDAEQEAAETQTWLEFALACNYMEKQAYEQTIRPLPS